MPYKNDKQQSVILAFSCSWQAEIGVIHQLLTWLSAGNICKYACRDKNWYGRHRLEHP